MSEKINLQGLVALLAEKNGTTKKEAEIFLKEFFQVINGGLFEDELVKVKNLGSFKLVLVNSRESVDVTKGDRVLIPAHYKVSYSPDTRLAETINEPFSLFEVVEINENADTKRLLDSTEESIDEPADDLVEETIEEPVEEIVEEPVIEEPVVEEIKEEVEEAPIEEIIEEAVIEQPVVEEIKKEVEEAPIEEVVEEAIIAPVEEEADKKPVIEESKKKFTEAPVEERKEEIIEVSGRNSTVNPVIIGERPQQIEKKPVNTYLSNLIEEALSDKKAFWGWTFYILAFLVIGGIYFYYEYEERRQAEYIDTFLSQPIDEIGSSGVVSKDIPKELLEKAIAKEALKDTDTLHAPLPTPLTKNAVPDVSQSSTPKRWRTVSGDRLTLISLKEYGHKSFWVYIYQENRDCIHNPDNVPVGIEIVIPPASKYGINKNDPESIRKADELALRLARRGD
jgi:nucleoid DNA-binding protein/nucleoid-associated protein YgaU